MVIIMSNNCSSKKPREMIALHNTLEKKRNFFIIKATCECFKTEAEQPINGKTGRLAKARGGASKGHACTIVHPLTFAQRIDAGRHAYASN
jgi:hypothetical protein